nr:hypothetical protein [Tanacetum cinerariifolium]
MFSLKLPQDLMIRYFHLLHGAFTALASVPAIYIQQFWNTLTYDAKTGAYIFQLDETRFTLDAYLLRDALEITPIDQAHYPTKKGRKDKPHVIPYYQFTKIIICHLGIIHNIHQRLASPFHLTEEDFKLGNLKFVPKGKIDEVFGMPIPDEMISNNIKNALYYNAYLEMVAKHDMKMSTEKEGKKKTVSGKQPKSKPTVKKASKPAPASKSKASKERPSKASADKRPKLNPAKETSTKTTLSQPTDKGKVIKVRKAKSQFQLVDKPDEEPAHSKPKPKLIHQGKGDEDDMELAIRMNAETGARSDKTSSGGDTKEVMDEDQAGPDPGESHGALAGPDPEPTHDEFMADMYPKVNESLKFLVDEHVFLEDPISSTGTLSSMKNLEDAFPIRDQFINDKSTKDELEKPNIEAEVVSLVTVPIYQASSLVPQLSTPIPVIDLSPPKPASSTTQAPVFTATTTTTTTTTPLPPHPQQQISTELELAERVADLEKKLSTLEQTNENLNNTTQNLESRAVQIALQAPLRDHFRDLFKEDMKEMLHSRMFESGSYKSAPKHITLYEALEASIERAQMNEFLAKKDKSRKRRRDDQDPPTPPSELYLSKRRRHHTDASGSSPPQAPQSSAWMKSDTRDAPPRNNSILMPSNISKTYQYMILPTYLIQRTPTLPIFQRLSKGQNDGDQVRIDVGKPLPPSGPPCYALSISKMKDARYLDFGLELLVPKHMWINEVCTYDISASYGISHWWFNRQKFYIDRHSADSSHKIIRTHMRILSVVSIKAFSRYRYDYLKEITLRIADYQEYTIVEKDFKSLYPSDFEDLNMLLLQDHLNHLSGSYKHMLSTAVKLWTRNLVIRQRVKDFQLGIESYRKQLNLTKPGWDAKGFEFKHDYTIIESPRVVVFPVGNNEQKIMRFNEIYKFSDGTLTYIMEALDYKVKEYKVNRFNPGMNTWFWTDKDVERIKEFIHAIERRLKTRRIF